jgi:hypothetical protein
MSTAAAAASESGIQVECRRASTREGIQSSTVVQYYTSLSQEPNTAIWLYLDDPFSSTVDKSISKVPLPAITDDAVLVELRRRSQRFELHKVELLEERTSLASNQPTTREASKLQQHNNHSGVGDSDDQDNDDDAAAKASVGFVPTTSAALSNLTHLFRKREMVDPDSRFPLPFVEMAVRLRTSMMRHRLAVKSANQPTVRLVYAPPFAAPCLPEPVGTYGVVALVWLRSVYSSLAEQLCLSANTATVPLSSSSSSSSASAMVLSVRVLVRLVQFLQSLSDVLFVTGITSVFRVQLPPLDNVDHVALHSMQLLLASMLGTLLYMVCVCAYVRYWLLALH